MEKQPIIFGYFANDELLGWRADSWGNLTFKNPKIYHYSENQIKTIIDNVRSEINGSSSKFFEQLSKMNIPIQDINGNQYDSNSILEEVKKQESIKKEYKDFEVRIFEFVPYEEGYVYPESWKIEAKLKNLDEPLEIHKFTTIENQN